MQPVVWYIYIYTMVHLIFMTYYCILRSFSLVCLLGRFDFAKFSKSVLRLISTSSLKIRISIAVQHREVGGGAIEVWADKQQKVWVYLFYRMFCFHPLRQPQKRPALQFCRCGNIEVGVDVYAYLGRVGRMGRITNFKSNRNWFWAFLFSQINIPTLILDIRSSSSMPVCNFEKWAISGVAMK